MIRSDARASGYEGVGFEFEGPHGSMFTAINGGRRIETFDTKEEAAVAYARDAKQQLPLRGRAEAKRAREKEAAE